MSSRVALLACLLGGGLLIGGSALAQPSWGPRYDAPPQPRSRVIEDYPAGGPRYAPPPRYGHVEEYPPPGRHGGPWDCNESRCINRATGDLWESTCNYRGCFPLRPARSRGYGRW